MEVTCGANFDKRYYAVTLSKEDLVSLKGQEFVDALSVKQLWQELNKAADTLVVVYIQKNGGLPEQYAKQRIREING